MSEASIYSDIITTKTGLQIPVMNNGKTVESRYDPIRECDRILDNCFNPKINFIVIIGIAGGNLIQSILQKNNESFILAVETDDCDISFLSQIDTVKKLINNNRVCLCSINQLGQKLMQYYIPAFYGSLQIIEQPAWVMENRVHAEEIKSIINSSLKLIAADFSVQSHFGKLWMHNIVNNLKTIKGNNFSVCPDKTAVILAAGPTLDKSIQILKDNPDNYYIIACDTALSVLISNRISPDAVVSLDGQYLSTAHFIHEASSQFNLSHTQFILDISSNSSVVKKLQEKKYNIHFFTSGHPFCAYINEKYNAGIPYINSGSGTVTICAVDFAVKTGFEKILVLGADFAYINGKPYAKGTYLDRLYNVMAFRLHSSHQSFMNLEYRTPLIKQEKNGLTTTVLEGYKNSFLDYLKNENIIFSKSDDIYKLQNLKHIKKICFSNFSDSSRLLNEIILEYKSAIKKQRTINNTFDLTNLDISLLPLISWLRNHDNKKDEGFLYYYKKALEYFEKF